MDWLERLIEERDELREKVTKLNTFLMSDKVKNITKKQLELLKQQEQYMFNYLHILNLRIEDAQA